MNFPRYWPSVRRIHRSSVNSPHKGQWRGALIFSLIWAWINSWVNDGEAGDLRRHCVHYDVIVMKWVFHSRHTLTQASFAHNVISYCPIVLKFYTGDGSRTAVLCAKFEMITQMKAMLWANEISRDLSLRLVSDGCPSLYSPIGFHYKNPLLVTGEECLFYFDVSCNVSQGSQCFTYFLKC